MTVIKGNARQTTSVGRVDEGAEVYLRMLRDGTIGITNLIALWSLEGRVFTSSLGAATTPVTFGVTTLDTTEFDLHVAIPASVVIIPLEFTVNFDLIGATGQVVELALQYGTGSITGAGTADIPPSSNATSGLASACTVTWAAVAGTALTTVVNEFWHDGIQRGSDATTSTTLRSQTKFSYLAKQTGILQVIGPSQQLVGWASALSGVGFARFVYAELPVSAVE